jgi:hypothetical protein
MNPIQQPTSCAAVNTAGLDLTPADVLRGAALYVRRHGLHQGDMFANPDMPYPAACAQGAIKMAACGNPSTDYTVGQAALVDDAIATLADHLDAISDVWHRICPGETVADWNDYAGRTADHVAAALTAAAERWDRTFGEPCGGVR